MQNITITGSLGRDAEIRQVGNGNVASFSVASSQGFGDRKTTNWFKCNLWGARGDKLAPYLLKGGKVAVSGDLTIGEYQGKPQYEISVSQVELMGDGGRDTPTPKKPERSQQVSRESGGGGGFGNDLDDDVPFATCDPTYDNRRRLVG